jgi:hypothetical protein
MGTWTSIQGVYNDPCDLVRCRDHNRMGLTQGAGIGTIAVMNVISAAGLQFGYLGGTLIWALTSAGRLGTAKPSQPARPLAP